MKFDFRQAEFHDLERLKEIYLEVLEYLESQDYPMAPEWETVEAMFSLIFQPAIATDAGPFVATEKSSGRIIGVVFWTVDRHPIPMQYRTATSYGQWVAKTHRGKGMVAAMVVRAVAEMKRLKVKRILDMVHTPESVGHAEAAGFTVSKNFVTLEL